LEKILLVLCSVVITIKSSIWELCRTVRLSSKCAIVKKLILLACLVSLLLHWMRWFSTASSSKKQDSQFQFLWEVLPHLRCTPQSSLNSATQTMPSSMFLMHRDLSSLFRNCLTQTMEKTTRKRLERSTLS